MDIPDESQLRTVFRDSAADMELRSMQVWKQ